MAERALVLKKDTSRPCKIGDAITIDACSEETHTLNNTVTDHPVEVGSNISDHVRPDSDMVTLVCFVSNTPLSRVQQTRAIHEGSARFETTAQEAVEIGHIAGRGADTFNKLAKLRKDGTLVEVVTTLKTYGVSSTEGMVIQSLSVPRTTKNYDGLAFTVTFKQIRLVRNKQTRDVRAKDTRAQQKKKKGAQAPATPAPNKSAAVSLGETAAESGNGTIAGAGRWALGQ